LTQGFLGRFVEQLTPAASSEAVTFADFRRMPTADPAAVVRGELDFRPSDSIRMGGF